MIMAKKLIALISIFVLMISGCIDGSSTHIDKSFIDNHTKTINVSNNNGFLWNYVAPAYIIGIPPFDSYDSSYYTNYPKTFAVYSSEEENGWGVRTPEEIKITGNENGAITYEEYTYEEYSEFIVPMEPPGYSQQDNEGITQQEADSSNIGEPPPDGGGGGDGGD